MGDVISYLSLDSLEKLKLQAAVLDYVSDSVLVHDMDGRFLYVNKVAYESRGYTHEELLGMHVKELDVPDHESMVEMKMNIERMKRDGFVTFERNHRHKDGSVIPVEIRAQVFELQGHKLVISVARDIQDRKQAQVALRKLASTDPMTGLLNRHEFQELYDVQVEKQRMYETSMCLLLMDIDHFKSVNDQFGHNAGDVVIKDCADCLQSMFRGADVIGRWGGEEFIILLPETTQDNALKLAEKLRQSIAMRDFNEVGKLTISIGVTAFCPKDTLESFVKRADAALYKAKQSGRNCVIPYSEGLL